MTEEQYRELWKAKHEISTAPAETSARCGDDLISRAAIIERCRELEIKFNWEVAGEVITGLRQFVESLPPFSGRTGRRCKRAFPCRYSDPRQCARDTMLGTECPKVCECDCHVFPASPEHTLARCPDCNHSGPVDQQGKCQQFINDPSASSPPFVKRCGHRCESVATEVADELVDEVQKRMDSVVERAVEWYQAGREGAEWFDAAEALSAAIDSLLELRAAPNAPVAQPAQRCRYTASVLPMVQCVLNEGHAGEHRADKGPLNLQEAGAHAFTAESKSLPCDTCGLIYSASVHHEVAQLEADPADIAPCRVCASMPVRGRWFREEGVVHCSKTSCFMFERPMSLDQWNRLMRNEPSTTTPATAADVAESVYEALAANDDVNTWHKGRILPMITNVLSRYLPAQQPEVEPYGDMTLEEEIAWRRERDVSILSSMKSQGEWIERLKGEVERARRNLIDAPLYNKDGSYTPVAQNIHDHARADAIGEAIEVLKRRHPQVLGEIRESDATAWVAARSYLQAAHKSLLAALEQLKGEGSGG